MVTRSDVAKLVGVSEMTVTRVVTKQGYVSEKTRKKVEKAIKELNYIPNKLASALVQQNSKSIAVILPEFSNPYYTKLVEIMTRKASEKGFSIHIFLIREQKKCRECVQDIISNRLYGVLNLSMFPFEKKDKESFESCKIKVIDSGQGKNFLLNIEYETAIKDVVLELKKKNTKNPVCVIGKTYINDCRLKLFMMYCSENGIKVTEERVLAGDYPNNDSYIVGYQLIRDFFNGNGKADAIYALNDMMAFGALKAVRERGLSVPDNISVIGFDNLIIDEFFCPQLTSIGIDLNEQAECYIAYLTGRKECVNTILTAKLFLRQTI